MFQAYIDDSGSTPQGAMAHEDRFVLAGYVMMAHKWEQFSDEWNAALKNRPKIEYFKMGCVKDGGGPFVDEFGRTLSYEFRFQKARELAEIIARFDPLPVSCSASWEEYERIVRGKVHPKLDSPYTLLYYQIMRGVHEFQVRANQLRPDFSFGRVDFIFDEQGPMGPKALQWYEGLRRAVQHEPYKSMMGNTPIFRSDRDLLPLQAADMLAWHIRNESAYPDGERPLFPLVANGIWENRLSEAGLNEMVRLSALADKDELDRGF